MQVFPIAPSTAKPFWLLVIVLVAVVTALVMVVISVRGARWSRFEVTAEGLRLRGDLYGRLIPKSDLRLEGARRVNLEREVELQPVRRSIGTAMPGYQSGWFRLRNGEKALLYLTDRSRAVYIPTKAGYVLLLSPADPEAMLQALRAAG